jgi:hypothetical protein
MPKPEFSELWNQPPVAVNWEGKQPGYYVAAWDQKHYLTTAFGWSTRYYRAIRFDTLDAARATASRWSKTAVVLANRVFTPKSQPMVQVPVQTALEALDFALEQYLVPLAGHLRSADLPTQSTFNNLHDALLWVKAKLLEEAQNA